MCDNIRLRGRLILPVTTPALSGGVITLAAGRIVAVMPGGDAEPTLDLGDVAILPGLVNAHTHLEFSDLDKPLGRPAQPFVDWIRDVIAHRTQHTSPTDVAIQAGADECVRTGTTTIGEIATAGWRGAHMPATAARVTVFRELRGMSPERVSAAMEDARDHVVASAYQSDMDFGLSPHAPYSAADSLLDEAVALAASTDVPLAMHLAESPEEMEFLQTRQGPFRQLLGDLGAWDDSTLAVRCAPIDYLKLLAHTAQALVIHGNYLDSEALDFMAAHASRLALVYCPRTHAYFGHPRHPVAVLLRRGGTVALGTDSRASNPDLNMWSEMRFAAAYHPDLCPADVLRMGTLGGAQALGRAGDIGSLDAGKRADLTIVAAGSAESLDDEQGLFEASDARVVATVIDGVVRYVDSDWSASLAEDARQFFTTQA
jgi:cytosine/adenosine deaminase-related metal-dependent hydrolase